MVKKKIVILVVLRLLIPLLIGVVFSYYTKMYGSFIAILSIMFLLIALEMLPLRFINRTKRVIGAIVMIFFFVFGTFITSLNDLSVHPQYFLKDEIVYQDDVQLRLLEEPVERNKSYKVVAEVLKVNQSKSVGKVVLYISKDSASSQLKYGDELVVNAKFQPMRTRGNPKASDYGRYLTLNQINCQTYIGQNNWMKIGNSASFAWQLILNFRASFGRALEGAELSAANRMVTKALLLGEKGDLDKALIQKYAAVGAMHVLAVSGLHVGIVMLILGFFLKPVKRLPRGKSIFLILVLVGIWLYVLLTGMSSSVMRAAIMFSFIQIGREIKRENGIYQSIFISAFIMILMQPLVIFQVGFQLSYAAVIGIVYLQPKIYNLFYTRWLVFDKIWQISSVSLAAQLATFPIALYYFHQFPTYFLLSNLLVIPMAFLILLIGVFYLATKWLPILEELTVYVFDGFLTIMNTGVGYIESMPFSSLIGYSIEWFEVFILYLIIIFGVDTIVKRRKSSLFVALFISVLIVSINIIEHQKLSQYHGFVIYTIPNDVAVDVFYGRENVFYSFENLRKNDAALTFSVKQNWFYHTGESEPSQFVAISDTSSVIPIGHQKIWLTNQIKDSIPKA